MPSDCWTDPDAELHDTLLAKVFPRKATAAHPTLNSTVWMASKVSGALPCPRPV